MKRSNIVPVVVLLACLSVAGGPAWGQAQPAAPVAQAPVVKFVDITRSAGIDFKHSFGDEHMSSILESTGSGDAFLDYDNDGDQDLYMVTPAYLPGTSSEEGKKLGVVKNQLYRNEGKGTFTNVTDAAGVGDTGFGMSAAVGDFDGDGYHDIYVSNYGPNVLYRNKGDGTFEDVTAKAGVAGPEKNAKFTKWSVNSQWLDYDNDGDLDLFLGNYLEFDPTYKFYYQPEGFPGPEAYLAQPDFLYRNNGDGTFTDVSVESGVQFGLNGKTMGVGLGDFDNDGWSDIMTANDAMENFLYHNEGTGKFKNIGIEAGIAFGQGGENVASMHPAVGDFNNDLFMDTFIPDMTFNSLLKNTGDNRFEDVTFKTGATSTAGASVHWGGGFLDFDNDGNIDLVMASGGAHHLYGQQAILWKGKGDGTFQDVSLASGDHFKVKRTGRGAAWADIDNDGDLDLLFHNIDLKGTPALLRNDGANQNNWLAVRVVSKSRKSDAIGAKVIVEAAGRKQKREIFPGQSYLSQCDLRAHFGLGAGEKVDKLEVHFPGAAKPVVFKNIKPNQIIEVTEGAKKFRAL